MIVGLGVEATTLSITLWWSGRSSFYSNGTLMFRRQSLRFKVHLGSANGLTSSELEARVCIQYIALASNLRRIQVKDIVKEIEDYLKTYSSARMDISGGSHVTNVPPFDVEDLSSWKDRFLVYLDGFEPYPLEILENRPFMPKSPASTPENVLIKRQRKWSPEDKKLVNQDKRLKRIIISCLPNDIMKYVIKCTGTDIK
ncbi:hypothetical protein Tco_0292001 [Tanacetum coccineum]